MSGRKLSEVKNSLQVTEELQREITSIEQKVSKISKKLQSLGKPSTVLMTSLNQLNKRWGAVLDRMTTLKEAVAKRARRGEQHGFDSEYAEAERISSDFGETKSAFRKLSNTASDELSKARDDLDKNLKELRDELNSKELFTVLGKQTASEFAVCIGLGKEYLTEVSILLAQSEKAFCNQNVAIAQTKYTEAMELWQKRKNGLQVLHDRYLDLRAFARTSADFFANKQGFQVEIDFRQVPFRLSAKKAGSEYSCEFGAFLDADGNAEQIPWDTPHGTGCIEVIGELNQYLLEHGFLHRFTQAKQHPDKPHQSRHQKRERGEQP